jgi:hypothetical protein
VVASVGGEVGDVELAALLRVDGRGIEMRKSIVKRLMEIMEDWDKTVTAHYRSNDDVARQVAEYLIEAGQSVDFDNRYSARLDRTHVPGQKDHVHLLLKGKEVCVINKDGTPSHNSDISAIPRYLRPKLRHMGVKIEEARLIVEAADASAIVEILRHNIAILEAR